MSNYQISENEKQNFNLFLNQYYLASIKSLKFIGPIILGIFLVAALISYFVFVDYIYKILIVLGLFFFFRIRSIKVPDLDIEKLEIYEETGRFSTISNAGNRVMFNNYHAYNIDPNKLQQNGLYQTENVVVNYIILRADRKMIYVFNANGISDITLPLRK